MRKIGIYGGSFDPPHLGHRQVLEFAKKHFEEVWVVPCGHRSDKHKLTEANLRYQMAVCAFKEFKVLDIEIQRGHMIPTYELMKHLEQVHPNCSLSFLLSVDLVPTLQDWDFGKELVEEVNFVVFPREGHQVSEDLIELYSGKSNFRFIQEDLNISGVSSTLLRKMISEAYQSRDPATTMEDWGLLQSEVIDLVIRNNLYA